MSNRELFLDEISAILRSEEPAHQIQRRIVEAAGRRLSIAQREGAVVVLELAARRLATTEPGHWFVATLQTMAANEKAACRCKEITG
jgi:uncharacterized protein with PIN domain